MEPLIFTTKGNLPIASLDYSTRWEDCAEYTKLIETYKLGGEVVRESVHVMGRAPVDLAATQQPLV